LLEEGISKPRAGQFDRRRSNRVWLRKANKAALKMVRGLRIYLKTAAMAASAILI
jgi:hypothetical protein